MVDEKFKLYDVRLLVIEWWSYHINHKDDVETFHETSLQCGFPKGYQYCRLGWETKPNNPDYHTANIGFETVSLHALQDLATTQPTKIT